MIKIFITLLFTILIYNSGNSQATITKVPFTVNGKTLITPVMGGTKSNPQLLLNVNEMAFPVSNAQREALKLKADLSVVNLKADKSDLALKADKSDLVLKADKTDLLKKADQTSIDILNQAITNLTNKIADLTAQNKLLKDSITSLPVLQLQYFNGKGDSVTPLINGPFELTKVQRLAIVNPKLWLMVIQVDGDDQGLWIYLPRTGWKQII